MWARSFAVFVPAKHLDGCAPGGERRVSRAGWDGPESDRILRDSVCIFLEMAKTDPKIAAGFVRFCNRKVLKWSDASGAGLQE